MSLKNWEKNNWLVKHKPSAGEISQLLGLADRDLKDSQAKDITDDWKLNIAYNSALQSATAALLACGYRASREMHHFRVVGSLAYTMGTDASLIQKLDKFRKKRNSLSSSRLAYFKAEVLGAAHSACFLQLLQKTSGNPQLPTFNFQLQ